MMHMLSSLLKHYAVAGLRVDSGISVADGFEVALEMANVYRVKANLSELLVKCSIMDFVTHNGDPKPDIGLG